jgi:3-deoxy-7-phosphoheptulonate synthase
MLWIGDRTRGIDEAHIAWAAEIKNPVAIKIGPTATPEDVVALCERLNPKKIPGKLTLIIRMGADKINELYPPILRAVINAGHSVIWSSDPMHGNTYPHASGRKTRDLDTINQELSDFKTNTEAQDAWPGGLHIEATAEDVTECMGGSTPDSIVAPIGNYDTLCDPRLNGRQALELALRAAS